MFKKAKKWIQKKFFGGVTKSVDKAADGISQLQRQDTKRQILEDEELDPITRRELLADTIPLADQNRGDAARTMTSILDTLAQAKAGEGKYKARVATQKMFETMREQPGLRQTRQTRQHIL